ncbi:MAG: TRAP transporter small permease [Pseudolabrys sp.]|jgi:TRAP-type C4-dicarboxylate transport system permease small subunit
MAALYRQAMDALYLVCVWIAGSALVLISAVIPWAVFTRYVLNSSASWPERTAVLLTIVLTFIGTAACYRAQLHMNVSFFAAMLPPRWRRWADLLVELLVGAMSLFMVIYGEKLVEATWLNSIDEFPELSVGVTYLPIPLGGAALFLFVIERVLIGAPPEHFIEPPESTLAPIKHAGLAPGQDVN